MEKASRRCGPVQVQAVLRIRESRSETPCTSNPALIRPTSRPQAQKVATRRTDGIKMSKLTLGLQDNQYTGKGKRTKYMPAARSTHLRLWWIISVSSGLQRHTYVPEVPSCLTSSATGRRDGTWRPPSTARTRRASNSRPHTPFVSDLPQGSSLITLQIDGRVLSN